MSLCNNCGKYGHLFQQCKSPINSYGIIAFSANKFIMIRRKDSFGYIDFIRGKYSPYNIPQLQKIINEMSVDEKNRLLMVYEGIEKENTTLSPLEPAFNFLWQQLWGHTYGAITAPTLTPTPTPTVATTTATTAKWARSRKTDEEHCSFRKYEIIVNGVYFNKTRVTLQTLIQTSNTSWTETEWEFPKGRRNTPKEKELDCALREFEEETGICKSLLHVVENVAPFEETFIGTNYKAYKHKYFLAYIAPTDVNLHNFQQNEVSKLECVTLDQAMEYIRPYNIEKKTLLRHVYNTITQFNIVEC